MARPSLDIPVSRRTAYDEFPYPGFPYVQTHPDRLATLASLFGMSPAAPERCRLLELGCGDGGNLIPMAYGLPRSSFVGVDLAPTAIAAGRERACALALENVQLVCGDLADLDREAGEFDFIVAHGVYSWVSAAVRDRLMAVCRAQLAPNGIAFVSYNALPGGHTRAMLREMMLHETRGITDPQQCLAQARAFLRVLASAQAGSADHRRFAADVVERAMAQTDALLVHDLLAPVNEPVYFHEFVAHAAAHRLQYLAEADFCEMHAGVSSPIVLAALDAHGSAILAREQYLDFLKLRMYRQTLLCRAEVTLSRQLDPEVVSRSLLGSQACAAMPDVVLWDRSVVEFDGAHGAALQTDEPIIKLAIDSLSKAWPRYLAFNELLASARVAQAHHGVEPRPADDDARVLQESLLRAYAANLVELHTHQPSFAATPGARPRASALARLQAGAGDAVTTLRHGTIRIDDDAGRRLLTLLDGTRDRQTLMELMSEHHTTRIDQRAKLDAKLAELARLAVLET